PDTIYGTTFLVLSPEHELVNKITTSEHQESIEKYQQEAAMKSDLERTGLAKEKSGGFTGAYAINLLFDETTPSWIADYVLSSYGTGAVMAVPSGDQRDYEFAKTFDLPVIEIIEGGDISEAAYDGDGPHINSGELNGLYNNEAIEKAITLLEQNNAGT